MQTTNLVEKRRKTVGEAACELLANPDRTQTVGDTAHEMTKGYIDSLIECAQNGEKLYGRDKPFYVCVQTRRERLLENVIRNQFYPRQTRPTPTYDLALYHYEPKTEELRFVWCIPDKQTVADMSSSDFIPSKDQEQLYWFVMCFLAGTLV